MSDSEIILSVNAGSSSVKVSVYSSPKNKTLSEQEIFFPRHLAETTIEGLTAPPATLKYERGEKKVKDEKFDGVKTQEQAFVKILEYLEQDEGLEELQNREDIRFTCHRVVHGGDFPSAQVIDEETYHRIAELSDLAPLHNAPALSIIRTVSKLLPHSTHIAKFDTSFHSTLPKHISTYPIDQSVAQRNKLRKYGFHGISYKFITQAVAQHLGKPKSEVNIIALHLGSGASACCIKGGKSWDTSMGLTPLAGLPGATRSGSIDPSLMFHFTHEAGKLSHESTEEMHITQAEEILNKKSGWKSLTGTTDFGAISKGEREEDRLAFDIFVDRILNYVGPYFTKLDGECDALVFAGGIGERGAKLRTAVVRGVRCLGFAVDEQENEKPGDGVVEDITGEGARYKTFIVKTDEQLQMARGVLEEREKFVRRDSVAA